jgi:putative restriction endonuclease
MCAIHHKAFDSNILGIRPDYAVEIREDVLKEIDGPMLRHGLQGFQGKIILLPHKIEERPDRYGLEERYQRFRSA